jgi:hypothetical protein
VSYNMDAVAGIDPTSGFNTYEMAWNGQSVALSINGNQVRQLNKTTQKWATQALSFRMGPWASKSGENWVSGVALLSPCERGSYNLSGRGLGLDPKVRALLIVAISSLLISAPAVSSLCDLQPATDNEGQVAQDSRLRLVRGYLVSSYGLLIFSRPFSRHKLRCGRICPRGACTVSNNRRSRSLCLCPWADGRDTGTSSLPSCKKRIVTPE